MSFVELNSDIIFRQFFASWHLGYNSIICAAYKEMQFLLLLSATVKEVGY